MNEGTWECLKFHITSECTTMKKMSGPSLITMILLYDRIQALYIYESHSSIHFPRRTYNIICFLQARSGQTRNNNVNDFLSW